MPKYQVNFFTIATKPIEVEADNKEHAMEVAQGEFDYEPANISNGFELDDWELAANSPWLTGEPDTQKRIEQEIKEIDA